MVQNEVDLKWNIGFNNEYLNINIFKMWELETF